MLCHGPVWVPEDAVAGQAVVRVEFPESSRYRCVPTDLPVELVE
jgi:hypothetical protein